MLFPEGSYCLTAHMGGQWLRRWLSAPAKVAGRLIDASDPWSVPLASFFHVIAEDGLQSAPVARTHLADQMGSLLVLATGARETSRIRHGPEMVGRIKRIIEKRFEDAGLSALTHLSTPAFYPDALPQYGSRHFQRQSYILGMSPA